MTDINNTNSEPMVADVTAAENTNTAPQENGTTQTAEDKAERTFTQTEVNEIISKRLARQKTDAEELAQFRNEKETQTIAAENRKKCQELVKISNTILSSDAYPEKAGVPSLDKELLNILPTDDYEAFKKYATMIQKFVDKKMSERKRTPTQSEPKQVTEQDVLSHVFGLHHRKDR